MRNFKNLTLPKILIVLILIVKVLIVHKKISEKSEKDGQKIKILTYPRAKIFASQNFWT